MKITKARLRQIILEELQNEAGLEERYLAPPHVGRKAVTRGKKPEDPTGADTPEAAAKRKKAFAKKDCPEGEDCPEAEEEEVKKEGSGDRKDPRTTQGRGPSRQRAGSAGNPGDLEELKRLIARELKNML